MLKVIGTCFGNDPVMFKEMKGAMEREGYIVALNSETTGTIMKEVENFYEYESENSES